MPPKVSAVSGDLPYDLTDAADDDLADIYAYTFDAFGEEQAAKYLRDLSAAFLLLSQSISGPRSFRCPERTTRFGQKRTPDYLSGCREAGTRPSCCFNPARYLQNLQIKTALRHRRPARGRARIVAGPEGREVQGETGEIPARRLSRRKRGRPYSAACSTGVASSEVLMAMVFAFLASGTSSCSEIDSRPLASSASVTLT